MTDGFTVLPYYPDSTLLPGVDCPGPEDRGLNLFFGGLWNEWSAAGQGVDVSALQALIDQGKLRYTLSGYLGGWEDQDDVAVLTVSFLDGSAAILDTGSIGPVWPEDRNYATGLLRRTTQGRVPAGTRSLDIELGMWRGGGFWNFNNDGYADNLELYLHVSDAPGAPTD